MEATDLGWTPSGLPGRGGDSTLPSVTCKCVLVLLFVVTSPSSRGSCHLYLPVLRPA